MGYSKPLVKLIDEAIIPALLLVGAKILGTVLVNRYFSLPFEFTPQGITYFSTPDYLKANSYSSLFMYAVVLLGLFWVLLKSHALHKTHISPNLAERLFSLGLSRLVQTTFNLYSQAVVWLSYAWLTTLVLGIQAFFGLSYKWVAGLAFLLTLNSTWLMVLDVEREIALSKRKAAEEEEETILKFADLEL